MTQFGGFGGSWGTPDLDPDDAFAMAVERALGDKIRSDDAMARAVWSALAGVDWVHFNGDTALYTWRSAGDIVAAIRDEGDYMDWYGKGDAEVVSDEVRTCMAGEGWSPIKPML
jgi:hypothetical protein